MIDYTTTELIADIKQRASVPNSQSLFSETALLRFLSNKLRDNLVPLMLSARSDYFIEYEDIDVTNATALTNSYELPERAIGMSLKDVVLIDAGGYETSLPRLNFEDKSLNNYAGSEYLYGFYIQGNSVKLYLKDSFVGKTLRLYYFRRPNGLVKTSDAGKIMSIDTNTNIITLDNAPSSWTTASTFDFIQGKPPFDSKQDDATISAIAGFDLTFTTIPDGIAVGDWVCLSGESTIPQIPFEAFSLLTQLGVIKLLEAANDNNGWQLAVEDYRKMEKSVLMMISPRVESETLKITSRQGIWRTNGMRSWVK